MNTKSDMGVVRRLLNTMLNVAELTSLTVATIPGTSFFFGHAISADGLTTATLTARHPCPTLPVNRYCAARPDAGQVPICRRISSGCVIQRR